ncbi:carbohydrate ABC transporter permease [Donghicola tyrosinivorans]|uniref:sn-glycerol 3-phosphate transport system permease protein n=1 Tax=Donghicola tyrosinivorans TaxID=1652492 RepID=A0A2T0WRP2_9RHOB|nr:sugar ABC transporter permease [Donghicola tyrosinivorans]PRY89347.1 sn-glycerol 3-phosphate transport system permease protein [Donghicola tyrosinivorans]
MVKREWIYAWALLLPAFVFLITFTHLPAVQTLINSLYTTPKGRRAAMFTGLGNYQQMLSDPVFLKAMVNSGIYALVTILASILLALAMALLVHRSFRGVGLMRMSFFTPTVLPLIAVANIWLFFYAPGFGLIDQIRVFFGLASANYAGQPDTALYAVAAVTIWKEAGFFMIFFLAALQTVPETLREAAAIEGCSRWTFFRRVTLPLIMPTTLFVSVNAVINAFRLVDHVFVMTKGGPDNASMLLLYYIFETGFRYWDTAYAGALTMVLIAILAAVGIGQFFLADKRVHYR